MFQTLDDFLKGWKIEADATQNILNQLTDESLTQQVTPQNWTLGRIAWHIVAAIGNIASRAGLSCNSPAEDYPVTTSAKFISDSYQQACSEIVQALESQWTDSSLREEHDIMGQKLSKGDLLLFMILHQIHHRGQMTILMRQAGLTVPGLYGPSKEEWAMVGMEAPKM